MNEDDKKAMEKALEHWHKDTTIGLSHMPIPSFSAGFEAGMAHARGVSTELLSCPSCGGVPQVLKRTMTLEQSHWLASISCHCGEYSSCAYQFGVGRTHDEAMENAVRKWKKAQATPQFNMRLSVRSEKG